MCALRAAIAVLCERIAELGRTGADHPPERARAVERVRRRDEQIGRDPAAAIDHATVVGLERDALRERKLRTAVGRGAGAWAWPSVIVILARGGNLRLLNAAPRRSEPSRRGELERARAVVEAKHRLRASLAVRCRAENRRAIVVLQRARDDLRRARTVVIEQRDELEIGPLLLRAVRVRLRERAPAHRHDRLPGIEKEIGHLDPLLEQPARIRPQIEHERLHSLRTELRHRLAHLVRARVAEDREVEVADAGGDHRDVTHRVHSDLAARERERDARGHAGPLDQKLHVGARLSTDRAARVVLRPALGALAVDRHDAVAGLHSRALRRRARKRSDDGDPPVAHVDLDADARVVTAGALVERAKAVGREIPGMRIVQLAHHSLRGLAEDVAVRNRVDEVPGDVRTYLLEQLRALVGAVVAMKPALQQPSSEHERERERRNGDDRASTQAPAAGGRHFGARHEPCLPSRERHPAGGPSAPTSRGPAPRSRILTRRSRRSARTRDARSATRAARNR